MNARLSRIARANAAGAAGLRLAGLPAVVARSPPTMSGGCRNAGSSGSNSDRNAQPLVGGAGEQRRRTRRSCPAARPATAGTPAAATARRCSSAAASCRTTPPSLVKFSVARSRGDDRRVAARCRAATRCPSSGTRSLPPADTDATADPVSWHAGATTGVPARRGAHVARAAGRRACPARRAAAAAGSECPSSFKQPGRPVRVRASTNCVVVAMVYSARQLPGQPVVQEVGNGASRARRVDQVRRRAAGGVQLIERVERQELDAGDGVDPLADDALETASMTPSVRASR